MTRRQALQLAVASAAPLWTPAARAGCSDGAPTPGNKFQTVLQRSFAEGMECGMVDYERGMASRKQRLFSCLQDGWTIADVGIGTGPNLRYMPRGARVVGVEPNREMWPYARAKAAALGIELRLVDGRCESLPLRDASVDAVVTTLVLCSVSDVRAAAREICRVLRPAGAHIFVEHVLAPEDRPLLRAAQHALSPLQTLLADGCHLDRETGVTLASFTGAQGYDRVEIERFDVSFGGFEDLVSPIRPHVAGIAWRAAK